LDRRIVQGNGADHASRATNCVRTSARPFFRLV
jgi:hypothetical protein